MTENDKALIETARGIRSNFYEIQDLFPLADSEETLQILREEEDRAFRCHERIAFEDYD